MHFRTNLPNHFDKFLVFSLILCFSGVLFLLVSCIHHEQQNHTQAQISLPSVKDSTRFYQYSISYPDSVTSKIIADTLQYFALRNKKEFMRMMPDDTSKFYVTPWELIFKSKRVSETARFEAYENRLYLYTGGAHGMPSINSLTLDRKMNKLVKLEDLFRDTTALKPISRYAMNQIASKIYDQKNIKALNESNSNWVMDGAAPAAKNYAVTYPAHPKNNVATGMEVIFNPYQVGPYAIGMPHIFVPDSVFHEYLKPEYQSAFE